MKTRRSSLIQPLPQRVYGNIIYWLSIVAAMLCTVAPVIAITFVSKNVMDPHYLFYTIWEGKTAETVWQEVGSGFPGGHFWVSNLTSGDSLTQFGLVLGCCCASMALAATAIAYIKQKPRSYGWALISLIIAVLVLLAALGIYRR